MKDPNDKKTIDGFADLVTALEERGTDQVGGVAVDELRQIVANMKGEKVKSKAGRKPAGDRALTPAEKQKAYRLRQKKTQLEAQVRTMEIKTGKPVTSDIIDLTSSFTDVYKAGRGPGKAGTQ